MSNYPVFLDVDTLTSQILPTPSPPADNAKTNNLQKRQLSTLHVSKATETLLVRLLQKVQFKRCLLMCHWRCGELVSLAWGQVNSLAKSFAGSSGGRFISKWFMRT